MSEQREVLGYMEIVEDMRPIESLSDISLQVLNATWEFEERFYVPDFREGVTELLLHAMRLKDWNYGEIMPEITLLEWKEILKQFEVEE